MIIKTKHYSQENLPDYSDFCEFKAYVEKHRECFGGPWMCSMCAGVLGCPEILDYEGCCYKDTIPKIENVYLQKLLDKV